MQLPPNVITYQVRKLAWDKNRLLLGSMVHILVTSTKTIVINIVLQVSEDECSLLGLLLLLCVIWMSTTHYVHNNSVRSQPKRSPTILTDLLADSWTVIFTILYWNCRLIHSFRRNIVKRSDWRSNFAFKTADFSHNNVRGSTALMNWIQVGGRPNSILVMIL